MKRYVILLIALMAFAATTSAQSSMTDDQIMQFVVKEHNAGTSQAQIVTKLMQRGVNITQIRRVRDKYERQIQNKGMGVVADQAVEKANSRMRTANGEKKKAAQAKSQTSTLIQQENNLRTEIEDDEQTAEFQRELSAILPTDTIALYRQLMAERKTKKVFGRDIFNNKKLTFEPNMNIATPSDYRLGPGDAVIIDIYGASQKSNQYTVSPDGDVTIEGFGPVQVSGLTVAQANARLRQTLGSRYQSSKVRLTVGQTKTIMVNVMGEVRMPGTYTLSAFSTVFNALYMAGGPNDIGTLRDIKIFRANRLIAHVDVYDYILNGKASNIHLTDNDVIVVGPYDCLVNITGKVKRPMYYEMKKSESVGTLLKYAGSFTGDAYTRSVRLIRKTGREYSVYNVGEFDMNSFHIADGDSITVDSILNRYENMVEVKGAVFRPGKYQVGGDITSVRSLIEHAEGCTEQAFTAHAVMHRMKADRTLEVIPVDIDGIMQGRVADVPLQKNDVLFVPTKQALMEQQTLTIHGEVHYPGIYQYAANETIEDLILQAGGLNDQASTVKVDVARRIRDPKALTTDSIISQTYTLALKDGFVIDGQPGFRLMPYDEVYVRRSPGFATQQNVYVEGQVMFAGTYTLARKNERISDVIRKAGGVTDLAYVSGARLLRRTSEAERAKMRAVTRILAAQGANSDSINVALLQLADTYPVGIELGEALKHPGGDADLVLREGDQLIIPEYNGTVKISGDVMFPNTVAYEKGKRFNYYIDQAGGFGQRAKKSRTIIVYMNGTVGRVAHNAKVRPGCEIVVPSKPRRNPAAIGQWLGIGSSVASLATMIASLANLLK
ncbi:SLBB domain-containing protein [Prevotella sp. P5-64]|uniref:polysaccharide biosynthesis/export family protein n=1 Tax=Prevotella sp. P5-64 TaxID=2024226 RepID=UPI000B9697AB|nr:SLBB domain-containing protein [Prevotella sp. P5-64]OYP68903.1 capsule biosynthesis protein [Prevotella sp. P5-64]